MLNKTLNCEEGIQGLQDLFDKVDLYFDQILYDESSSDWLFSLDSFKTFCENIYRKSGVIKIDNRVISPPFSNLYSMCNIEFYSHDRAFGVVYVEH